MEFTIIRIPETSVCAGSAYVEDLEKIHCIRFASPSIVLALRLLGLVKLHHLVKYVRGCFPMYPASVKSRLMASLASISASFCLLR